ncbi:Casein kinase I isoform epsilon [Dirofilaria immitis]
MGIYRSHSSNESKIASIISDGIVNRDVKPDNVMGLSSKQNIVHMNCHGANTKLIRKKIVPNGLKRAFLDLYLWKTHCTRSENFYVQRMRSYADQSEQINDHLFIKQSQKLCMIVLSILLVLLYLTDY